MNSPRNSFVPVHPNSDGVLAGSCRGLEGGTKTIGAPQYTFTVASSMSESDCEVRDDDFLLLQDDDSSTVCIDTL